MSLLEEIVEHRMLDSYAGYDWGDPVVLWTVRARWRVFTFEELEIADRAAARAGVAS